MPFGFASPFNVAVVSASKVAGSVSVVGRAGIVNERTDPVDAPAEFEASAQ